jgi:LacI family transcriptional regulator
MASRITDVAKQAGVSTATVSRVIHNSGYVAHETREKVLKTIDELDYLPNAVAQSLKTRKTGTIGLVITNIYPHLFHAALALNIELKARKIGYRTIMCNSLNDPVEEANSVRLLMEKRVDGIVFATAIDPKNVLAAKKNKIPVVLIERNRQIEGADLVLVDNVSGSFKAVEHLIKSGHKKIGFIGCKFIDVVEEERYEGYLLALREFGLEEDKSLVKFLDWYDLSMGYSAVIEIIKSRNLPSAIFTTSDVLAMGALQALHKNNIRVPEECSVIGYDDVFAPFASPRLTAVSQPFVEMAGAAVDMLIKRATPEAEFPPQKVVLQPHLVIREST